MPIVGAPMSPQAGGRLAAAISNAGGLGMIGVASGQPPEQILTDAAEFRQNAGDRRFGIGLMTWAVDARPELLDAALEAKPFAISMSFGDPTKYGERIRAAGIELVSQVRVPVVAAGGIATGRGLAAVIAAGAAGAWIGTPFLVAEEARNSDVARKRLIAAVETETVLTSVFDVAQSIPWPKQFRGRGLRNNFSDRWDGREAGLTANEEAHRAFDKARKADDFSTAVLYAGQSVGLLDRVEPAGDIVRRIAEGAEARLREVAGVVAPG